jgi:bifunctional DNA-binding transcriptional regulator/antitoxin component of YhaV-PrlF toxin-antitoxin module
MKLQKQKTRELKGKEYFRYAVVIPQADIEKLGWKDGEELEPKTQGQKLIIEPSK